MITKELMEEFVERMMEKKGPKTLVVLVNPEDVDDYKKILGPSIEVIGMSEVYQLPEE